MDVETLEEALRSSLKDELPSTGVLRSSTTTLEAAARYIALHLDERASIVDDLSVNGVEVWERIKELWVALVDYLSPATTLDDGGTRCVVDFATALTKFERNLIAGVQAYQNEAISGEPLIRQIIFNITTFARIEDASFFVLQTVITQLLSNLISPISLETSDHGISDSCLDIYLSGRREDDIVVRLLDSQEVKVTESTLRMLNNLLRNSPGRQVKICVRTGRSWLTKILGRMDEWHDGQDQRFALGTDLIHHYIFSDLTSKIYELLSDDTEPITPSQSTLLKLIDANLSSPDAWLYTTGLASTSLPFLVGCFNDLARYCLVSIQSGQDDARLPQVFEGLILVSEALSSIGLKAQERRDKKEQPLDAVEEVLGAAKDLRGGIIRSLVDLLRQLDSFLPRVKPGQASPKPTPPELTPVSNIKRDLVRLIGILAFSDIAVGDQVREHEGVQLLLSMTEVDESNPYLREHALFAVRNLMKDNPANQAVIAQMDPVGVISESGELLPLPERLRRQQRSTNGNESSAS